MSWEIGPWQILACGEQLCVRHCIQRTSHLIQQLDSKISSRWAAAIFPWMPAALDSLAPWTQSPS